MQRESMREKQSEIAAAFDDIHPVERARQVGSLTEIITPAEMRSFLIRELSGSES
jgi:hypothetical protein